MWGIRPICPPVNIVDILSYIIKLQSVIYYREFLNLKFTDNPTFNSSSKETYVDKWPYMSLNGYTGPPSEAIFMARRIWYYVLSNHTGWHLSPNLWIQTIAKLSDWIRKCPIPPMSSTTLHVSAGKSRTTDMIRSSSRRSGPCSFNIFVYILNRVEREEKEMNTSILNSSS